LKIRKNEKKNEKNIYKFIFLIIFKKNIYRYIILFFSGMKNKSNLGKKYVSYINKKKVKNDRKKVDREYYI